MDPVTFWLVCLISVSLFMGLVGVSDYAFFMLKSVILVFPVLFGLAGVFIIVAVELPGNVSVGGRVIEFIAGGMCLTGFVMTTNNSRL